MDVHVPYAITIGLRLRGIDVLTSQDDSTTQLADPDLLERANALGRALFTQDKDFLRVASEWRRRGQGFAGIIYAHQAEVTISWCIITWN
jgi:predicted nuclease of predicted toxin-antitoxin system